MIIKSIDIDFSIIIPNVLAEKYIFDNKNPRAIFLQQMMVKVGENYKMDLKYTNSQLFVNGNPFSFRDIQ